MVTIQEVQKSSQTRDKNHMRGPDGKFGRCFVCNLPVSNPGGTIEFQHTNGEILPPGDPRSGGEDSQGCFYVGPECAKHPKLTGLLHNA